MKLLTSATLGTTRAEANVVQAIADLGLRGLNALVNAMTSPGLDEGGTRRRLLQEPLIVPGGVRLPKQSAHGSQCQACGLIRPNMPSANVKSDDSHTKGSGRLRRLAQARSRFYLSLTKVICSSHWSEETAECLRRILEQNAFFELRRLGCAEFCLRRMQDLQGLSNSRAPLRLSQGGGDPGVGTAFSPPSPRNFTRMSSLRPAGHRQAPGGYDRRRHPRRRPAGNRGREHRPRIPGEAGRAAGNEARGARAASRC